MRPSAPKPVDFNRSALARPCGRSEPADLIEGQRSPSIFNGETFPDFFYSLVERIKSGVKGSVVKIKYVPDDQKSENPVVGFHID